MISDAELLQRAAIERDRGAFATLVQRHVGLVHATALRLVRSPDLAADVSQLVFLELAAHLPRLRRDTHLAAWLYVVARRRAIDLIRRESTRMKIEAAAPMETPDARWAALRPLLDEVLAELTPDDREAVVRRFLENEPLRDVAAALGVSEDAAQKRVGRALERLRVRLARRGISAAAGALAGTLSTYAAPAAPAGLAAGIVRASSRALAAAPASASLRGVATRAALPAAAVVSVGVLGWLVSTRQALDAEVAALSVQTARWQAVVRDDLATPPPRPRATAPTTTAAPLTQEQVLERRIHDVQAWAQEPGHETPLLRLLTNEEWILRVNAADDLDNPTLSAADRDRAMDAVVLDLCRTAAEKVNVQFRQAAQRFRTATGKAKPENVAELLPFLATPIAPDILREFSIDAKGMLWWWYRNRGSGVGL